MTEPSQTQEDIESKAINSFKVQIVSLLASLLLLILSNAQIRIFSFICVIILPITLLISLFTGIRTMICGRKGWKNYRSKSARRMYHIAGAVVTAPIVITVLVIIVSLISEFFS